MKVGVIGPSSWSKRVSEFTQWVDVQWGTNSISRARELIAANGPLDAIVVDASPTFINSELVRVLAESGLTGFAVGRSNGDDAWVDDVSGIIRVGELAEIPSTRSLPVAEVLSTPSSVKRSEGATRGRISAQTRSLVIAVWGPVGAPGISSVAIGIAAAAARNGRRVHLCDADTRGASIAIGLGLIDDVPGFAAACRLGGRGELTNEEIGRLSIVPDGFGNKLSVLTGLPRASRWAEVAEGKARTVVNHLRELADVVVVDVGSGIEENEWIDGAPQRDGAARAIIREADVVLAVGRCDAVGLARLIRGLDELSELSADPLVILNQSTRQSGLEARDALSRFTRHEASALIPRDNRAGLEDAASRATGAMKAIWAQIDTIVETRGSASKR